MCVCVSDEDLRLSSSVGRKEINIGITRMGMSEGREGKDEEREEGSVGGRNGGLRRSEWEGRKKGRGEGETVRVLGYRICAV